MSDELLFWSRLNSSISSFCLNMTINQDTDRRMAVALVGDELEWCGPQAYLFIAQRFIDQEDRLYNSRKKITELEHRTRSIESMLNSEMASSGALRKQIKQTQILAEDNEWQLQEQLAQMNTFLQAERDESAMIRARLAEAENKLVEVEFFLGSDRGSIALQLEEQLAEARLKIAELEADKDDLEMRIKRSISRSSNSSSDNNSSDGSGVNKSLHNKENRYN